MRVRDGMKFAAGWYLFKFAVKVLVLGGVILALYLLGKGHL